MPDISITSRHNLGLIAAEARLRAVVDKFAAKYATAVDAVEWTRGGCAARGRHFAATADLSSEQLTVKVDLINFAARMAKALIKERLETVIAEEFGNG